MIKLDVATIEGLKEVGRKVIIAVIAIALLQLQASTAIIDPKAILVAGLIALLSGIDNWLSEKKVGFNNNGLTGM